MYVYVYAVYPLYVSVCICICCISTICICICLVSMSATHVLPYLLSHFLLLSQEKCLLKTERRCLLL